MLNKGYDRRWKGLASRRGVVTGPALRNTAHGPADHWRQSRFNAFFGRRSAKLPHTSLCGTLRFPVRRRDLLGMPADRARTAFSAFFILFAPLIVFASPVAAQKFRADEWITECDRGAGIGSAECSITVPFWQSRGEPRGSFALVIMLQTGNIGIVGQPFPQRAILRIDKNPPIECRQARYCIFPTPQALAALKQLRAGTLILIDVFTAQGTYKFSLTPKGYQAGIAQIRAWGYRTE